MKINLQPTLSAVITYWQAPIIVGKIANNSTIKLIVTSYYRGGN